MGGGSLWPHLPACAYGSVLACRAACLRAEFGVTLLPSHSHFPDHPTQNRYLIVLYYNPAKMKAKASLKEQEESLRKMQEKFGVDGQQHPAPAR